MTTTDSNLSRPAVRKAYEEIKDHIHRTPVLTSSSLSASLPGQNTLYFKAENFQRSGAFKFRGAALNLKRLSDEELARGVCTHSSGNHGAALALAAKEWGAKCYVVMPHDTAQPKIDAVQSYGAEITFCEPTNSARVASTESVQARTGAIFVSPDNAVNTILGQGTTYLELAEQVPEPLAAVIAPVGGGGLLAGTIHAADGTALRIFGAEPAGAADCAQGLQEGKRVEDVQPNTLADGLRTPVGTLNFPVIQEKVERVIVVSDEEIVEAMRLMWERLKIIVEPSGATAFAAVRSKAFQELGIKGPIGIIISGGNIDLSKPLPWA